MANKDIIQELSDLGSSLATAVSQNPYSVPETYFDGFAAEVLGIVRATDYLSTFTRQMPYQVPAGYFEGMHERVMETIRNHADYQTSKEELESLSPLLSSLNKRPVYSVPQGYFESFNVSVKKEKPEAKIVSIAGRRWFRYAAAAVVTGVIAMAAFLAYNNKHENAADKTLAKFEKEVKKIDDVKKTQSLIDFMDAGLNQEELANNSKTIKTDDVQKLLQDIPLDELKDFNDQSKDIEDVMMTN